jgi:osmoprotectant transport system permease protein
VGVDAVGARAEGYVILGYDSFRPSTFVDAFRFMYDNQGLMWNKTVEHLVISGEAMGIALLIAIPLGIWLGHLHRGSFLAINLANVGRALPSLAVIAIGLGVFGIGTTNVAFALVVLAFPLILTNAYVGVDGVDPDAIEAARGMGMRPYQIVLKIELPLALPLIFAGIKTAAVYVVATATLGGVVGGGGLGDIIVNQASYFLKGVIAASIAVAVLAFAASFAFGLLQWAVTPRGLRRRVEMIELDVSTGVAEAVTT